MFEFLPMTKDISCIRDVLNFYANAWQQDVDADRTATGWEGRIGEMEPSEALREDRGDRARQALSEVGLNDFERKALDHAEFLHKLSTTIHSGEDAMLLADVSYFLQSLVNPLKGEQPQDA